MATEKQIARRNKLLARVADHIEEEPLRMNMTVWENSRRNVDMAGNQALPSCGTAACIFGWVNLLGRKRPVVPHGSTDFRNNVAKLLHLDIDEANALCHVPEWPAHYRLAYEKARDVEVRTHITVLRIKRFIKSKGKV